MTEEKVAATPHNAALEALKPCPNVLCDLSRPYLNETDGDLNATHTWVYCENCGACGPRIPNPVAPYYARTSEWDEVKAAAVKGWNTRAQPRADAEWAPIGSAPRDGTSILVVEAAKSNHPYLWERWYQAVHQANFEDGVWVAANLDKLENEYFHVTHWRPLPAAPAPEAKP